MSIMDLKKNAPKGEFLAYINKKEAAMLKKAGGSGKLVNGIPSFRPQDMGNQTNQDKSAANTGAGGGQRTGTTSGRYNPHTDTGYSNSNYKNEKVTGDQMRDHANAFKIGISQPKTIPSWMPGGTQAKIIKSLFGTPKTKMGKRSITAKRMAYINSLPPASRKAMIDRLGLGIDPIDNKYGDPTILGSGDYGKNLYGIDALDIINFNGDYMKQYGPKTIDGGGDGNPYILPQYAMMGGGADMGSEDVEEKTFEYRMGDPNTNQALDVTLGRYFNQGGRITRAGGGIMNAVPRQGYFLGGIGKAIGKAVGSVAKAAGKVLSSDVGKMALAAGAFYYGGGGAGAFKDKTFFGGLGQLGKNFMSTKNPLLFNAAGKLSLGKLGLASAALPLLAGGAKPNEDIGMADRGGRLLDSQGNETLPSGIRAEIDEAYESGDPEEIKRIEGYYAFLPPRNQYLPYPNYAANGGRIGKAEGGLMNLGGMEKDYRAEGGFVPIGKQEKADDVPARLSVNEFVFTADAVRNAGQGDIDKGAEVMENMMKNLENGGTVSEESQGNTGAQEMFSVSERIGEVI